MSRAKTDEKRLFYIDLLFYHRGLSCLVAFELKTTSFKPEYIGKMNFYTTESITRSYRRIYSETTRQKNSAKQAS